VPEATPVTIPLPEPIDATEGFPETHVPPPDPDKEVVEPTQVYNVPDIGEGMELTFTVVVALQPVGRLYVIIEVP
jgi:hypothetical protein